MLLTTLLLATLFHHYLSLVCRKHACPAQFRHHLLKHGH